MNCCFKEKFRCYFVQKWVIGTSNLLSYASNNSQRICSGKLLHIIWLLWAVSWMFIIASNDKVICKTFTNFWYIVFFWLLTHENKSSPIFLLSLWFFFLYNKNPGYNLKRMLLNLRRSCNGQEIWDYVTKVNLVTRCTQPAIYIWHEFPS